MRETSLLNEGWLFSQPGHEAVPVTLPHTWNAVDGQDGGNDYFRGVCTYTKHLYLQKPQAGSRLWLEFCGAAMTAEVFLNGEKLAHHEGGYSTFRVDITDLLTGDDTLVVTVDNGENDRVYPQKADFTFYGGLYRDVYLITVPAAHFALNRHGGPGVKVTPKVAEDLHTAEVTVEAWVSGPARQVQFTLGGQTLDAKVIDGHAQSIFRLENIHLWDGVKDPYLYTLQAKTDGGDTVSVRFGCRSFSVDAQKGFILNGRPYPLRGVSRHQDWAGLGNALTADQHRQDMDLIREIGANTIRLAHYQHAQEFYDLCDEAGMIVWAEIPYITHHMKNGRANTLSQMEELVTQNYNHPSIVCWGLSNEITASPAEDAEDLLENHRQLNELCHTLDKTRPTAMAHAFMLGIDDPILDIPDVSSYNLYYGWYLGELEQNDAFFDGYHAKYPSRVIGFSEYGADANPAFQSPSPQKGDYSETYQCIYHEHILKMSEARPWLWATHAWNMFDFGADGRDEGGKKGQNQKGLVSFDRKLKKDAFYLYKAHWSSEPFVHICGSRYVHRAEDVTEVKVYSNQREVTLLVDGTPLETQTGENIFVFRVPLCACHTITAQSGALMDSITVEKADTPDPAYRFGSAGDVTNWFDKLDECCYSIKDPLGVLMSHPQTGPIVGRLMQQAIASRGDVAKAANQNENLQKMMAGMSLESLLKQAGDAVKPEQIKALNGALQQVKKA